MPKFAKPWFRPSRGAWYVTIAGKQHKLGRCTEELAYERAAALKGRLKKDAGARLLPSDSLPAVIDAFLDWLKPRRPEVTFEWYRQRLQRLARQFPNLRASHLTADMLEDWVLTLNLSVTSRRNYYRSAKKCLKWARSRRLIRRNLLRDLEVPNGESREVVVTPDQYQQLLALAPSENFRDLVVTTWETGCRPQESLRVEARHVELMNQRWVFPKSESKNKKRSRVVYLTDTAADITRRLAAAHPTSALFRNSNGRPWTPHAVGCSFLRVRIRFGKQVLQEQGLCVSDDEVANLVPQLTPYRKVKKRKVIKTAAELRMEARRKLTARLACSLVPRWSLYALRHTWATNALRKGLDPLTCGILLGHADPSLLARVYQHVALDPAHMLEQAKRAMR